ncbi:hypothetical protein [uncultured Sphingomonas sp.]|uniref:hypothetical protein n=1 Tax=uncultured Sphingomonas sp. TaxID=158754 RepID=UPI0025FD16AD|nr:hypothetical protein [uncultured Sphingomonas sp.]
MAILVDPLPDAPIRSQGREDYLDAAAEWADALNVTTIQRNAQQVEANGFAERAETALAAVLNAPGTLATSASELTIAAGSQSFRIQAGKALVPGLTVVLAAQQNPTAQMVGVITAYDTSDGDITVLFSFANGSGTFSSWFMGITVSAPAATAADLWAGTALSFVTAKALREACASQAVTWGATLTLNGNAGPNRHVTLGGATVLAAPQNFQAGDSGRIRIVQGASPYAMSFNTVWKFPGGAPSLTSAPGAVDLLAYFVHDASNIECTLLRGY